MKRNSHIFQTLGLLFYMLMMSQLWSLCQYGGLRRHMPLLLLGSLGTAGSQMCIRDSNCRRPKEQVEAFSRACTEAVNWIASEPVSLLVVGNQDSPVFPKELLPYTTRTDFNGGGIRLNFLVNYGWEWDLAGLELSLIHIY